MVVATTTVTRDTGASVQSHGEVSRRPWESDHPLWPALCGPFITVQQQNWPTGFLVMKSTHASGSQTCDCYDRGHKYCIMYCFCSSLPGGGAVDFVSVFSSI